MLSPLLLGVTLILVASCDRSSATEPARQKCASMDGLKILEELYVASNGNLDALHRMTGLSPSIIRRLVYGITAPTEFADWWLKEQIGPDFYKFRKNFFLLRLDRDWTFQHRQYLLHGAPVLKDQFVDSLSVAWEIKTDKTDYEYKKDIYKTVH